MRIVNENSYGHAIHRRRFTLQVEAILDGVPGTFNQPEDLMNWICGNPYVVSVSLRDSDGSPKGGNTEE